MDEQQFFLEYEDFFKSYSQSTNTTINKQSFFFGYDSFENHDYQKNEITNQVSPDTSFLSNSCKCENMLSNQSQINGNDHLQNENSNSKPTINMNVNTPIKNEFEHQFNSFKKNDIKNAINCHYSFPNLFINIYLFQNLSVYDIIFKITGAYLTQKELIFLRKNIFDQVMPLMTRDEQRSKIKNISCFNKYKEKLLPYLESPNIQAIIRDYLLKRRRNYEKMEMLENFHRLTFPKKENS